MLVTDSGYSEIQMIEQTRESKSSIIRLPDGTKFTRIDCQCGHRLSITSSSVGQARCANCGKQYMNIAYFYKDDNGMWCRRRD